MITLNRSLAIRPNRIPPSAWLGHIPFAAWLVEELAPSLFVELGTHHGASYLGFCQAISELNLRTRCYAVDTWRGDVHAAGYDDSVYEELRRYHDAIYADFSRLLRMTFDEALDRFEDGSVDLLHIDGLHTYDAVKHDFETWLPKLSNRSVVLFHDLEERQRDFGVWKYWEEVAARYPSFSFMHSHGLGVLMVGDSVPATVRELAELSNGRASIVARLFAALGRGVQCAHDMEWWRKEAERLGIAAASAKEELDAMHARTEELECSMREQQEHADRTYQELSAQARQAQNRIVELEEQLSVDEQLREHLQRQAEVLSAGLARAESHAVELNVSIARLEKEAAERSRAADAREADLKSELSRSRSSAEAAEQSQRELRRDLDRLLADQGDRDELIASLARDLHSARQALNDMDVRVGRGIRRLRRRVAPDGTLRARLVSRSVQWGMKLLRRPVDAAVLTPSPIPCLEAGGPAGAVPHEFAAHIRAVEPSREALQHQQELALAFRYAPWISLIVPVYRLPREILEQTLRSIEMQTYPHWQVCIAWADPADDAGWEWLVGRTAGEPRFRPIRLESNGGISRNSNAALDVAEGEFVALLDHDDTLAPWALFDMVQALQTVPDADFLYSDKDCIDEAGTTRLNPLFKPEWSPEMLHSVNYLTHFNLLRTSVVREVGGWDPETDGAQDWDIFFKVTERARHILRVPSIHYHWRILASSTSTGLQSKPYAILGQLRTQKNHFARRGLPARVSRTDAGLFHVTWPVTPRSVDVVIVQDGTQDEAAYVIELLCASNTESIGRLIVLHAGEPTGALRAMVDRVDARIHLLRHEELEWRSVAEALTPEGRAVVLLSGRAVGLSGGIVAELAGWVEHHPDIAWSGAVAVNREGRVVEAGRVVAADGSSAPLFSGNYVHEYGAFGGASWYRNVRCVSAYAVAFRPDVFKSGFAEGQVQADKLDACVRQSCAKAVEASGLRGLVNPFAVVYVGHVPVEASGEDARKYWADPYFSPVFAKINPLGLNS